MNQQDDNNNNKQDFAIHAIEAENKLKKEASLKFAKYLKMANLFLFLFSQINFPHNIEDYFKKHISKFIFNIYSYANQILG